MSAFSDYAGVLKKTGPWTFTKRVLTQVGEDGITVWASALAYSWLFAIFPFLIFLLSLIAFIPGNKRARVHVVNHYLASALPNSSTGQEAKAATNGQKPPAESQNAIVSEIPNIMENQSGGLLSFGIILALWSASSGMATTMSALNRCYDIKRDRPYYIQRPLAILLTLIVMVLIVAVLVLLPVIGLALHWLKHTGAPYMDRFHLSWPILLLVDVIRWVIAAGLMFLTVAVIYYFGPKLKRGFRFISPGSVFAVVAWVILGLCLKWYVVHFGASSYAKTYGAVGGVILLLFTFYLDALVLLVGAEINSEFDFALYGRTGGLAEKPNEPTDPCDVPTPPGPEGGDRVALRKPQPKLHPDDAPSLTAKLTLLTAGLATGLVVPRLFKHRRPPARPVLPKSKLPNRYPMTYRVLTRS